MYLTMREACSRLRLSRKAVRKRIAAGEIEAYKNPGRNGHLRIKEASIAAYEIRHFVPPAASLTVEAEAVSV